MVGTIALGAVVILLAARVLWRYRQWRNRTPTTSVRYVEITYEGADGAEKYVEGWARYTLYPSDMLAIEWYQDDRLEIAQHRIIEFERGDWERIEEGGPVPY